MFTSLPTLTKDRILTDDLLKMNKLYEYFLTSEYSQTTFYQGQVASLKYLLSTYALETDEDANDFLLELRKTLETLYSRYYDEVTVECLLEETEKDSGIYNLKINITTLNDGKSLSLNKTVSIADNKINFFKTHNIYLYKKEIT